MAKNKKTEKKKPEIKNTIIEQCITQEVKEKKQILTTSISKFDLEEILSKIHYSEKHFVKENNIINIDMPILGSNFKFNINLIPGSVYSHITIDLNTNEFKVWDLQYINEPNRIIKDLLLI